MDPRSIINAMLVLFLGYSIWLAYAIYQQQENPQEIQCSKTVCQMIDGREHCEVFVKNIPQCYNLR